MFLALVHRLLAIVSLALLALGAYLAGSWWGGLSDLPQLAPGEELENPVWRLWAGVLLIGFSFLGRAPMSLLLGRRGEDAARLARRAGIEVQTPTGAVLHLDEEGPQEAPVLIFVHGWGMDSGFWWDARNALASRYQVVAYDLAGLGRSKEPPDGRHSLDRYADDLEAVVRRAGPRRVILVGHSIGGMTVLTFCRRHAETLGRQVLGVVLENTTADNPSRTTILGQALYAMRPVLKPLTRLDVWLQPLVWAMHWQAYLSGASHLAMRLGGFGTRPTRAQLEQVTRSATRNPPAVLAKGQSAAMDWRLLDEIGAIRIPALVFIGGRDLVTVPQAGEAIASGLRQATRFRLDRAGHMGPLEFSAEYNAAIATFADETFTRGARWADAGQPGASSPSPAESPDRRPGAPHPPP